MDVQILGADGPIVWLPSFGDEGTNVWAACQEMGMAGFRLAVVETPDWNDALSPWPAPAVYQKMPPFGGHADLHVRGRRFVRHHCMPQPI